MLKLYNTLTRKKETFKPIKDGKVGVYTCGPTVYWFAHVGNFRSFVFADVLKRVLMYDGFRVKHVINVTDVGHLTSDADVGGDKIEEAARKAGKTAEEISHFYFDAFLEDFKKLNLVEPDKWVWASEHIREQIDMIKILEKKGFVYETEDGVYFDSSKFGDYGKLSRKRAEGLEAGKRIAVGGKKNKTDFALWKFSKPEDKRQQEWDSPWGVGFPGWHIECSAMAAKYLGKQFDIHTGGEDLMPVHHENEIAQSTCAFGVAPVNYWMHGAFLNIKNGKMSKSSGKIKTISELEADGVDALAYRYFCFSAGYRKPLAWSDEAIEGAVNSYKKLRNVCLSLKDDGKVSKKYLAEFGKRIDDDLDMPGALAVLWNLVRDVKASGKVKTIEKMDEVFGLGLLEGRGKDITVGVETLRLSLGGLSPDVAVFPKDIGKILERRAKARKEKDWAKSDKLRDELKEKGWIVKDSKDGFSIRKDV